jgi:endonuclease/exonuclease/phosphatase family metal-dependent hydrolase
MELRVATYNVHECRGNDGRRRPERVAAVLGELEADVLALQEVHSAFPEGSPDHQASRLARATGLKSVEGWTLTRDGGRYGNVLLTSLAVLEVRHHDLSVPGREPRGAIEVLLHAQRRLRVLGTHLGLDRAERRSQVAKLLALLVERDGPVLLLGDLNEPTPWGLVSRTLRRRLPRWRAPRSFPARWPLLTLDVIAATAEPELEGVRAHRSPAARQASDHLPVCGRLLIR